MTTAQITFNSALSTLTILDRQIRKDFGKVARFTVRAYWFLSSPAAMATYRSIFQLIQILCMVAIALGMSLRAFCDRVVEDASTPAEMASEAIPSIVPVEPATVEPEPETAPVVAGCAAKAIVPESVLTIGFDAIDAMGRDELRKECQSRGIRWSHAGIKPDGSKRHLTTAEMREALRG